MTRHLLSLLLLLLPVTSFAGGPLLAGGPSFGVDGQPITWNPAAMPISYRVDPGPMASVGGTVVISNAAGLARVKNMFAVWQAVATANVSFNYAGPLLPAGSYTAGSDVTTAAQYNDVLGSCESGAQSPIIFDADGSLLSALGLPPEIIGLGGACAEDSTTGYIKAAGILMNGKFQDGVNSNSNYELTANEFDQAMTHEIGHFLGLDHSQINLELLSANLYPCDASKVPGLPVMFPEAICQARVDAGLPPLAPDDIAWISMLYPSGSFASTYGTISGRIYFSDGISQTQGVNVIARVVDDPNTPQDESRQVAVSVISGYLFTGNPGQPFTATMSDPNEDNTKGNLNGSRNPQLIGYYQIPVPAGTYTVEVESIYSSFFSDSGIGPLNPPVPMPGVPEFWNKNESAFDIPLERDVINISPGTHLTGIDIILNGTQSRFDINEDPGARLDLPVLLPLTLDAEVRA